MWLDVNIPTPHLILELEKPHSRCEVQLPREVFWKCMCEVQLPREVFWKCKTLQFAMVRLWCEKAQRIIIRQDIMHSISHQYSHNRGLKSWRYEILCESTKVCWQQCRLLIECGDNCGITVSAAFAMWNGYHSKVIYFIHVLWVNFKGTG